MESHVDAMWPPCEPPSLQFCFKLSRAKRVTCQLALRSGRGVCGGLPRITTGQVWHDKFPNWVWLSHFWQNTKTFISLSVLLQFTNMLVG
jgi:hypothetical protein